MDPRLGAVLFEGAVILAWRDAAPVLFESICLSLPKRTAGIRTTTLVLSEGPCAAARVHSRT